jgi:hypothetical protein
MEAALLSAPTRCVPRTSAAIRFFALLALVGAATCSTFAAYAGETSCAAAHRLRIPEYLPVALVLTEQTKNVGSKDLVEDALLRTLLETRSDQWWEHWKNQNEAVERIAINDRAKFGRWPLDLLTSGYVVSVGPAQITPRAALRACKSYKQILSACNGNTRSTLTKLLSLPGALLIATAVAAYERDEYCSQYRMCNLDPTEFATLYNTGADLYVKLHGSKLMPNGFGKSVGNKKMKEFAERFCRQSDEKSDVSDLVRQWREFSSK